MAAGFPPLACAAHRPGTGAGGAGSATARRRGSGGRGGVALGVWLLTLLLLAGCAEPSKPRVRLGSLPYPGPFTMYTVAEPDRLGEHRYAGLDALFVERSRGLIYTKRAGLLDLAHLRMTTDWTWYYYQRMLDVIEAGEASSSSDQWLVLETTKPTRIHVQFDYPPTWAKASADTQRDLVEELAFRVAQKLAWHLGTWHEMAQWYGYRATVVIPEGPSAFTHDDTTAHLIGLEVAETAWRQRERKSFDEAVTEALDQRLQELGAVSARRTDEKVRRMRGRWWDLGGPKRRHVERWSERGALRPWLVADAPGEPGRWGEPLPLPDWSQVEDVSVQEFVDIRFEPNIWTWTEQRVLAAADTDEPMLDPRTHFPRIKKALQRELRADDGSDAYTP